jgi:orotidine-5'-phosphate decarboxylase
MIEAAVNAAGTSCGVFAVTVLTSLDAEAMREISGAASSPADAVTRLAALASSAGARGIVCSGEEISSIRQRFGVNLELIVPGVRLHGDDAGDQSRIVTPEAAAAAGATYIVLGRAVTASRNPRETMERIRETVG